MEEAAGAQGGEGVEEEDEQEEEADWFDAYDDVEVHRVMIADTARNEAYARAIEAAAPHIRGKVVLDVGAGTGILSLLCARAGARKVYAIEASTMAVTALQVVEANGYADVIEVVYARAEDVELSEPADVLVSEWMGFHLLHESMLPSVLAARDRLLRPGGLMLPRLAHLYCAPVDLSESYVREHFAVWQDVLGFDLSALVPRAAERALLGGPVITHVRAAELLAAPARVGSIDCASATPASVASTAARLRFAATRPGVVHGYALWFEVVFEGGPEGAPPVALSTAPDRPLTHWKQSVVLLPEMLGAAPGAALDCALRVDCVGRTTEISLELGGAADD